jgi:hypothetical protein
MAAAGRLDCGILSNGDARGPAGRARRERATPFREEFAVLLTMLFAVIAAQGPKLPSAEAGTIVRAAADYLIPPDRKVGTHSVVGRTVIFDRDRSIKAVTPMVDKLDPRDIQLTLPALLMSREKSITCDKGNRDCTVYRDAIYFAVDHMEAGPKSGEYRLVTTLRFAETRKDGSSALQGGTYTLTVGLVGDKYKHWEVLRSVPKISW